MTDGLAKVQRLIRLANQRDYYKVLGISRDASAREIKKGYKSKAIEFHPDKYRGDKDFAQNKMAEINQAYEVLSKPELKAKFDNGHDPNDPHANAGGFPQGGNPFGGGMPVFFQQGGSPFGGGGGGAPFQFEFRFN